MKKFKIIPAIFTLFSGFLASVIMIIHRYSLVNFMWILVAVMVSFYIGGRLICRVLNIFFRDKIEDISYDEDDDEAGLEVPKTENITDE